MDKFLRLAERKYGEEPSRENWVTLLRVTRLAGKHRFTPEGLLTATGGGEIEEWEYLPTGFRARIKNAVYPYRKTYRDLGPMLSGAADLETVVDTTNWEGIVEVLWREIDDFPELQVFDDESWQFSSDDLEHHEYRFYGYDVSDDKELNDAMFDSEHWESMD